MNLIDYNPATLAQKTKMFAGHLACPGCGASTAMKIASQYFPQNTVLIIVPSCFSVISGTKQFMNINVPVIHSTIAGGAAFAMGVHSALKAQNRTENSRVIVWAGDGSSFDIGLQSLSGALEKNIPFTYVCYDNEAYMNTGNHQASSTLPYSKTENWVQHTQHAEKKDFMSIIMSHKISYAANASIGFVEDFSYKIQKALTVEGSSVVYVSTHCPVGHGYQDSKGVYISRLAVEIGLIQLYEWENENITINYEPSFEGLEEFLSLQKRFSNISHDDITQFQQWLMKRWEKLKKKLK